jgi:hypothetical protein
MPAAVIEGKEAYAAVAGHAAFGEVEEHPFYGGFGRLYYPAVTADAAVDASLTVLLDGAPALYVPAAIGDGLLAYNGMALRFFFAAGIDGSMREAAVDAAFRHIDTLAAAGRVQRAWVRDEAAAGVLGPIGTGALNRGGAISLQLNGWVDLAAGEAALRRELRKSFRSLINWGRANMVLSYVNAANPDPAAFATLREFHAKVAGRTTRSQASWDAMFAWVASGGGELVLAHLPDGELVAATLVVDGKAEAYYATGVYDRERFDKPMAHWPLWNAIERARARGLRRFDLGIIPLPGAASAKEEAIGYFKRGFAMSIVASVEWSWSARQHRKGDQGG